MHLLKLPLDPHETYLCDNSLPAKVWWALWTILRQHRINRQDNWPFWESLRVSTRWTLNALTWTRSVWGYD